MEKWTRSLSKRIENFQQRVQTLLEADGPVKTDPNAPPFEPRRDRLLIDGLPVGLPEDETDRAVVVFNRLSALFDAGLLLEGRDGKWIPRASFREGTARPWRAEAHAITLPAVTPLQALRTPAAPLLKKLSATNLDEHDRCAALLVKPVPGFAYVLLSSWPDLWLKEHVEHVLAKLAGGFAP